MNTFLKSKIEIGGCHILRAFGKFYFEIINLKLVILKFEQMFEPNIKKSNLFNKFIKSFKCATKERKIHGLTSSFPPHRNYEIIKGVGRELIVEPCSIS